MMTLSKELLRRRIAYCLLFGILMSFGVGDISAQCHPDDYAALKAMYEATDGDNWTNNSGWDVSGDVAPNGCDLSGWYGISMTNNGRVRQIDLNTNNLAGPLPSEISEMSWLVNLYLWNNSITHIPKEIESLPVLRYIHLFNNLISTVPPEIGKITTLDFLSLSSNNITEIPKEIGDLPGIRNLFISDNSLTDIPEELGNLSNLLKLDISHNSISCYPATLNNLCSGVNVIAGDNSNLPSWSDFCDTGAGTCMDCTDTTPPEFASNQIEDCIDVTGLDPADCFATVTVNFNDDYSHLVSDLESSIVGMKVSVGLNPGTGTPEDNGVSIVPSDYADLDEDIVITYQEGLTFLDISFINECGLVTSISELCDGFGRRVDFRDTEDPTPICQALTYDITTTGSVSVLTEDLNNGSFDNCTKQDDLIFQLRRDDEVDYSTSLDFDCDDVGVNNVWLIVSDQSTETNRDSCMTTITITETEIPDFSCAAITVFLDASGEGSISPEDMSPIITDECSGVESAVLDKSTFTCSDIGEVTVKLTVKDNAGNESFCTNTVTVIAHESCDADSDNWTIGNGDCDDTDASINPSAEEICGNGIDENCNGSDDDVCPTCDDGIQNGDEEDVDCGGENCEPCFICPPVTIDTFNCSQVWPLPDGACQRVVVIDFGSSYAGFNQNGVIITEWKVETAPDLVDASVVTDDVVIDKAGWVSVDENITVTYPVGLSYINLSFRSDCGETFTTADLQHCIGGISVDIRDNVDPVARCREDITLQLDNETATLTADQFDDESSDNCRLEDGLIKKIKRTSDPDSAFSDQLTFGCEDIGNVGIELIVYDRSTETNSSRCSTDIIIENDGSCETCDDGIQNGDETEVDCGGQLCEPCASDIDDDGDGFTENEGDCDDTEPLIFPGSLEYLDADGDGFGDENISRIGCSNGTATLVSEAVLIVSSNSESSYVLNSADCDDTNPNISPDATEICGNTVDENCDGELESCDCDHPDVPALLALYNSTDGANWTNNDGWRDGAVGLDCEPCQWYGVECNANGRVSALKLFSNNLNGNIPESIDQLTNIRLLFLYSNNLNGEIPESIYNLNGLFNILLSNNNLSGIISPKIGQLSGLGIMNYSNNNLTGSIPESLGSISSLTNLQINSNNLSGPMPASLGGKSRLQILQINSNNLSGCIPETFEEYCDGSTRVSVSGNSNLQSWEDFCDNGLSNCLGCTDETAHNYSATALESDDSCETCSDGIQNGDETEVDCGGQLCIPCNEVDNDGDTYSEIDGDCDDTDASIHPGANEVCGDGIDQDCDGSDLDCGDVDNDDDNYTENQGDCDDNDPLIHPGAEEICGNAIDEDCDGTVATCPDVDGDGYTSAMGDCNDNDASIHPGAREICDGIDNDCDGLRDNGATTIYYRDKDGDGWGNVHSSVERCSRPTGYVTKVGDCDDRNSFVYPGAKEICDNGIDEDCDGSDLSCLDVDDDGDGYTENEGDCDDSVANIHPGAEEVCDGIDNDCDGRTDEGVKITYYYDSDGDGYGSWSSLIFACPGEKPDYAVENRDDCDDNDPWTYPGAPEICGDGKANNCSRSGEDAPCIGIDNDGDGYTTDGGDCDDNDPTIHFRAKEICDGKDNDCDGEIDEGVQRRFFADTDGDGFGDPNNFVWSCSYGEGMSRNNKDCDDTNPNAYPGAEEVCGDGIANDCSGEADLECPEYDIDNDGYTEEDGDCDDNDPSVNPGAEEICGDGIDSDCDGKDDPKRVRYYYDSDGDGYGSWHSFVYACPTDRPDYAVENRGDCDDNDPWTYPGAPEICGDGKVNDCGRGEDAECRGVDNDGDGYTVDGGDCDDNDATVHFRATEICDGKDNDCDGEIDEGVQRRYFADADHDGYGDPNNFVWSCSLGEGMSRNNKDCDDTNPDIHPRAEEICGDGIDNDCKGGDKACPKTSTAKIIDQATPTEILNVQTYPNPFEDILKLNIQSTLSADVEIYIFDIVGKQILTQPYTISNGDQGIELNLSNADAGVYFLQIRSSEGVLVTNKIVKH